MRISAWPEDPDYWRLKGFASGSCAVVVDGVDVTKNCVEADDQAGYADIYRHERTGRIRDFQGEPVIDRLRGTVVIVPFSLQ